MDPLIAALGALQQHGRLGPLPAGMRLWLTDQEEPVRLTEGHAVQPAMVDWFDLHDDATVGVLMGVLWRLTGDPNRYAISEGQEVADEIVGLARAWGFV